MSSRLDDVTVFINNLKYMLFANMSECFAQKLQALVNHYSVLHTWSQSPYVSELPVCSHGSKWYVVS